MPTFDLNEVEQAFRRYEGCTGDRPRPDNALRGLDMPDGRYSARKPHLTARSTSTRLYWARDHAGILATPRCA